MPLEFLNDFFSWIVTYLPNLELMQANYGGVKFLPGGKVKVSWRSDPGINVAEIASEFGGGGHEQASGAMIEGDLEEVRTRVITATKAQTS